MRLGMRIGLPVIALAALLGACSDSPTEGNPSGQPRVTVRLTDAAGDIKAAVVTISAVNLQGDNVKVVLSDDAVTTDLIDLANSTSILVDAEPVPAGTYAELRFVITGGYIEVENADGSTSIYASSPDYAGLPAGSQVAGALQMPSFAQSGLKVTLPDGGLRIDGEEKIVLVDFDVSRSFGRQAGQSSRWVMSPVLTATNVALTGGVSVSLAKADSVTLPAINGAAIALGQFKAVLTTAAGSREELALADANGDG